MFRPHFTKYLFVVRGLWCDWVMEGWEAYWSWMGRKWLIWQTGLCSTWSPGLQDQHQRTTDTIPTYYIVCGNHHYLRQNGPAPFIVGFYAHLEAQEINLSLPPRQAAKVIMNLPCILFPAGVHWDCSWQDCPGNEPRASLNLEEEPTQRVRLRRLFHPIWNRLEYVPARRMTRFKLSLHSSIKCWLMVPTFLYWKIIVQTRKEWFYFVMV